MISKPRIVQIRPEAVTVDERAQRELDQARVKRIAADFHSESLGVPTVSRRSDGTMVWIDGQTRGAVLVLLGQGKRPVLCAVYDGLTLAEEATLFRRLNNSKTVAKADDFRVAVTEGDPVAVAANKALEVAGWTAYARRVNSLRALHTLYTCWQAEPFAAEQALRVLAASWGPTPTSGNAVFIRGMWMWANRYGGPELAVEWDKLALQLAKQRGGATLYLAQARANADTRRISKADAFCDMTTNLYNRSRRSRYVPAWETGV